MNDKKKKRELTNEEIVAQFPLSRKDHIVVSCNLKFSGASFIRISPFFFSFFSIYSNNTSYFSHF